MKKTCYFCIRDFERQKKNVVYSDDRVVVSLADDWVVKGHTFVVWKKHVINISDLTEEEYSYFSKFVYRTEQALLKSLSKNKSIILKSGGFEPHLHFHIYPIMNTMSWQEIKDMFEMKMQYQGDQKEKDTFLHEMSVVLEDGKNT